MTFDDARALAQAIELREHSALGLLRLLRHDGEAQAVRESMTTLANAYVDASDQVDELLRRDDEE